MRWRLDDLEVFCAVVETGGITAAARRLDVPKSTVSKVLARLESGLGTRLIERNSRRLRMTPEGSAFAERAALIVDMAKDADAMMQGLLAVPSGRVVLAVPAAFCREILTPRLPAFIARYPRLQLELVVASHPGDLVGHSCDMAVAAGYQPDSALSQRRLMSGKLVWVTSPAYAAQHGLHSDGHADPAHLALCESRYGSTPLNLTSAGQALRLPLPPQLIRINDPICVREAVIAGMGATFLPERYCRQALDEGKLVEIWRQVHFDQEAARLVIVHPGGRVLAPRFRAVIGFLEETCRALEAA